MRRQKEKISQAEVKDFMIKQIVKRGFEPDINKIKDDDCWATDLGLDSLDLVETIMEAEQTFDIQIKDEDVADMDITVSSFCDVVYNCITIEEAKNQ